MNKAIANNNVIELKVGGTTNPGSLKTAIIGNINEGNAVEAICIGVAANYIATKAIIMVRDQLQMSGKEIKFAPSHMDITIEGKNGINEEKMKTAIRWNMTLK